MNWKLILLVLLVVLVQKAWASNMQISKHWSQQSTSTVHQNSWLESLQQQNLSMKTIWQFMTTNHLPQIQNWFTGAVRLLCAASRSVGENTRMDAMPSYHAAEATEISRKARDANGINDMFWFKSNFTVNFGLIKFPGRLYPPQFLFDKLCEMVVAVTTPHVGLVSMLFCRFGLEPAWSQVMLETLLMTYPLPVRYVYCIYTVCFQWKTHERSLLFLFASWSTWQNHLWICEITFGSQFVSIMCLDYLSIYLYVEIYSYTDPNNIHISVFTGLPLQHGIPRASGHGHLAALHALQQLHGLVPVPRQGAAGNGCSESHSALVAKGLI